MAPTAARAVTRPALARATLALLAALATTPAAAADIVVETRPVPLVADRPGITGVDSLAWRGGLELASRDDRFGGLSALDLSPEGRLYAVGDQGHLFAFRPAIDGDGRLVGIGDVAIWPLHGADGRALAGSKAESDAEALAFDGDGFLVGFERAHRMLHYRDAGDRRPETRRSPPGLDAAPSNSGIETLVRLPDGRLLALTEGLVGGVDLLVGWLGDGGAWRAVTYRLHDGYLPTDAAALPDGDVIVLERRYTPLDGSRARLRRIPAAALAGTPSTALDPPAIATLEPPMTVDNFEGLAIVESGGERRLFILSDDNFNRRQRTLLMMFTLEGD